jgi:hypothetical protein
MSFNIKELLNETNGGDGKYLDLSNMCLTGKLKISCPPEQIDAILNRISSQLNIELIPIPKPEQRDTILNSKKRRKKRNKKKKKQVD